MKNKSRIVLLVLALIFFAVAAKELKTEFPDLQMPIINRYIGEVKESSYGSPYKTYFHELSTIEKQAYNYIIENIYDMPEKILVPNLDSEELDNVFKAILNDNPDLIFLGRKCTLKSELWNVFISFEYIMTKDEYARKKTELNEVRDSAIAALSNPDDEWQTELEIHDFIVERCTYKLENNNFNYSSAYGCLVNKEAACEGYSKAAKLIFDKVGIESALVSGTAKGNNQTPGDHMWNIVKINGEYYHLDCTWDDPTGSGKKGVKLYTYFNVTDEAIGVDHFDFSYNPGCSSTSGNYYVEKSLCFENYTSSMRSKIGEVMSSQYNKGSRLIELNFKSKSSYDAAYKDLITDSGIYKVTNNLKVSSGAKLSSKLRGYYEHPEYYTLTFTFE